MRVSSLVDSTRAKLREMGIDVKVYENYKGKNKWLTPELYEMILDNFPQTSKGHIDNQSVLKKYGETKMTAEIVVKYCEEK